MKRMTCWALLLLATGCSSRQRTSEALPLRVETTVAEESANVFTKTYVGVIEEERSAVLSFPVAGTLARTLVDEGECVSRGALLAEVDASSAARAYEAAKAAADQAVDACERLKKLRDAQSLPEIKWVEAQTRLQQAEAACRIARKNLEDCSLRAPFAGVIGKRLCSAGETVLPGAPVMTLLEIGTVKVRFPVAEQEISAIGKRSEVEVSVAALGDRTFTASNTEKGVTANPATHTYDVRASLPNPQRALLPGMVCRVSVSAADAAAVITLPVGAVRQAGDGTRFVWTVQGDSVVRTVVETGALAGNRIVVTAGVRPGDRIVTDGMQKIGEGSKVTWQ